MKITKKDLNKIDLSNLAELITCQEAKGFFLAEKEHYKLLAYLSTQFNDIIISDIGTYKGCSALALSYNESNTVNTFDISNMLKLSTLPNNLDGFIFKNDSYLEFVLESQLICLDTIHDGIHERKVIEYLIENNWKGLLVLDDIHHFPEQNKLWNDIQLRKEDLTHIGHWSGTGLIYFE